MHKLTNQLDKETDRCASVSKRENTPSEDSFEQGLALPSTAGHHINLSDAANHLLDLLTN
jgi:hypothetical protein